MEQNIVEQKKSLESQIRECYGRVVYTHKTHEKEANLLLKKSNKIKVFQILLSVLTTGSFLSVIIGDKHYSVFIGAIFSAILLFLNTYSKNFELERTAEKHANTAISLLEIREGYLSLLTDMKYISIDEIIKRRDSLQSNLTGLYRNAPRTDSKAYNQAQDALKHNEEFTFSDAEIDCLLPTSLRKTK